jgi:hypothetical protein
LPQPASQLKNGSKLSTMPLPTMPRSLRSFIGTVMMVVFVLIYALTIMLMSPLILHAASDALAPALFKAAQVAYYLIAGLAWVFPLLPLIKWMNRPNQTKA